MIALLVAAAQAHVPVIYFAGPDEDWCAVINGTEGSDIVMLSGGDYTGPCDISANISDTPGEQTTVQSLDPLDPAVFVGSEADYVLRATGESLMLLELQFRDLPVGTDAVRVGPIREFAVRRVGFHAIAGTAVLQDAPVLDGLVVGDTELVDVAQGVVVGCDGACEAARVDVSENLVVGGTLGLRIAGAGGLVADNVLTGVTEGIRIDGVPGGRVEVAGNLVDAVGAAIAVVGGAELGANVAIGAPALSAGDGAVVAGNTWVGAAEVSGARLVNNAILGPEVGWDGVGNVVCDEACFVDAAGWDFFPAPGSPLREAGALDDAVGRDWCGRVRAEPPTVGAIEAFGETSFGPLTPTFKDQIDCALPVVTTPTEPTDTGRTDTETGTPGEDPSEPEPRADSGGGGCGCGGRSAGSWAGLLVLAVFSAWVRGRRPPLPLGEGWGEGRRGAGRRRRTT